MNPELTALAIIVGLFCLIILATMPTRFRYYYVEVEPGILVARFTDAYHEWLTTDEIELAWKGNKRRAEQIREELLFMGALQDNVKVIKLVEWSQ